MDKGAKIAVVGGGVEGRSVLEYLLKHGYKDLTLLDENEGFKNPYKGVKTVLGPAYLNGVENFDVVFRSPGITLGKVANAKFVTSSTKFFFEKCPCPIIGVSGTKGKGTCATLIKEMLGEKTHIGGNIGLPPLEFLDDLNEKSTVVLELSSFQLQDLAKSPHIAVLLNVTSDHLDYHADTFEYQEAKRSLLKYQTEKDFAILNRDHIYFDIYAGSTDGKLSQVSSKAKVYDGVYVEDGKIYHAKGGEAEKLMYVHEIGLVGPHNIENVLPAIAVGALMGVNNNKIADAVRNFKGLPHRIEFIRQLKNVRYYNDSCSTTPDTSIAGVYSFDEPLILIAGGSEKGADFTEWGQKLCTKENLQTVILIGETAEKLEEALVNACGDNPLKIVRRKDLEEATVEAYALAEPGSVVLLSPGCASFDMFKDYKERGEAFKSAVEGLH
ncbi:UDP-N-acetylmuramoyl-L-alanine--D-glutamate ligase [Patescibacteria group bacterium]|nr:UDP-N-acetylmuramoyl-L-alanine--D-glutamate ligase [Patescibacteria group bacterium]